MTLCDTSSSRSVSSKLLIASAAVLTLAGIPAYGATLTWDAGGGGGAITNGGGAWLTAGLWNNAGAAATWTSGDDAIFAGPATAGGAVTLASPTTVGSLTFSPSFTGTYTLGTAGQALTINNGITMNSGAGAATIISPITLGATQSWTNNAASLLQFNSSLDTNGFTLTFTGPGETRIGLTNGISGNGSVVVDGGLFRTVAGGANIAVNSYTGTTTVQNGGSILYYSNNIGTGNIILNGGVINGYNNEGFTRGFGTGNNQLQITGGTSGFGTNGSGTINFGNVTEVKWGTASFNPSVFVLGSAGGSNGGTTTFAEGIDLDGADRTITTVSTNNNGAVSGVIRNTNASAAGLIKTGNGTLSLTTTGTNTYNGGTTISAGTLAFTTRNSMPATGTVTVANGATLGVTVAGSGTTWGSGTGVAGIAGLTSTANSGEGYGGQTGAVVNFDGNSFLNLNVTGNVTESNAIGNGTATSIGLIKTGSSTLTLSANNSYTGGTTVAAGTLTLGHATDTLANTGAVTVNGGTLNVANPDTVGAVTLASGTISGSGVLTASSVDAQSGTLSAVLGGSGTLIKSTTGTITLNSANTFSGGTTLNAGTISGIASGSYAGFGTGLLTVNAGTLFINAANTPSFANNIKLNAGGVLSLSRSAGGTPTATFSGAVELAGNATVTAGVSTTAVNSVFSGNISDPLGNFTLTLNGTNFGQSYTFTGNNSAWSGGLIMSGGATTSLNLDSANASGTGTLTINSGTTNIRNASFGTGALNLSGGTIDNDSGGAITLTNNNVFNFTANTVFAGTNSLNNGTGNFTINGTRTITVNNNKLTLGGNQTAVVAGGIVKAGNGTLALLGSGVQTGAATISAGVLEVGVMTNGGVASSLGNTSNAAANLLMANGTTLRYVGTSSASTDRAFTINGTAAGHGVVIEASAVNPLHTLIYSGTGPGLAYGTNNQTRSLTLGGTNTGNNTFGKVIANNGSGATSLVKAGVGTWRLHATNTYTGATAVDAGTLQLGSAGSINPTSGITVAAGAALLQNSSVALTKAPVLNGTGTGAGQRAVLGGGGTGGINAAVTLDNVGDTLSPGNSPGILPFGVSQAWASYSYDFELNDWVNNVAGTDHDQITVAGTLDLSSASANSIVLNVISLQDNNTAGAVGNGGLNTFAETNRSWTIISATTLTGFDPNDWLIDVTQFTDVETGTWSVTQVNQTVQLNYVVPEPSSLGLLAAGAIGLMRRRRVA